MRCTRTSSPAAAFTPIPRNAQRRRSRGPARASDRTRVARQGAALVRAAAPLRQRARALSLGDVGRGKTYLMDLFFESLPFAERQRRHFHRFMYDVHARLAELAQTAAPLEEIAKKIAREAHVLCLDELFVSDIADAMIVGALLRALFRSGVTLVATSNLPPRRLYENGLQRERFSAGHRSSRASHPRARGRCGHRLSPARSHIRRHLLCKRRVRHAGQARGAFKKIAAGGASHAGTVDIEGRPIDVVCEAGTAIWFEFAALCAGPRSQNDYIEIARVYQTVFLTGVPQFDADHEDEARRFIALVDELYDHGVKLIVSAAGAPGRALSRRAPKARVRARGEPPRPKCKARSISPANIAPRRRRGASDQARWTQRARESYHSPKPSLPLRWMISKKIGPITFCVKICSRRPSPCPDCRQSGSAAARAPRSSRHAPPRAR